MNDQPVVVGIGASAGGVEALKTFFHSLPEKPGMAFVVVIHLSPDHESRMSELLQMQTSLKVEQIKGAPEVQPDHVYVVPPGKLLSVKNNHLELSNPHAKEYNHVSIDLFFRSLAEAKGKNAACVILSGSGSDGAIGAKKVKENGGIVIVQDFEEAEYNSMPRSVIEAGIADVVLPVKEIGQKLIDYKDSLSRIQVSDKKDLPEDESQVLNRIFDKIRSRTGHDFSQYKRSSILRRLERRLHINRINSLSGYQSYLKEHPKEIDELFKDLLISVTNFYRDPEAFGAVEEKVIPRLFEKTDSNNQLRVWVPGCATGEEAYSIAILLKEYAETLDNPPELKVFATDIDEAALRNARNGIYPESIVADLTQERLSNYFYKDGNVYTVKEQIREMVLFASHNLLGDPPFSQIDLVTCRNLLIYLDRDLQTEVFDLFHYCLRRGGWLFLGKSDSNLAATDLFSAEDKDHRIYRRINTSQNRRSLPKISRRHSANRYSSDADWKEKNRDKKNIEQLHQKLLMRKHVPPSAIINENYEILHSTENIHRFLKYSGGEPSNNILEMIIPELRQSLRGLLFQTGKKENNKPVHKKVKIQEGEDAKFLVIEVEKVGAPEPAGRLLHVIFQDLNGNSTNRNNIEMMNLPDSGEESELIEALEKELDDTKERLQVTVEEYETSNEDLRASNEELQSMNEELQSTTEELETSKEELQSVNEELKTVNRELEQKIDKLHRVNSDLKNLMEATEVGTIFVNREGSIKRFTSSVTDIFNLIGSDEGRPIKHVTHTLQYDSIPEDIDRVLENLEKVKKIVSTNNGKWYIMRLRPYQSTRDEIEGVVITFVEITDLKMANQKLEQRTTQQQALAKLGLQALNEYNEHEIWKKVAALIAELLEVEYCALYELEDEDTLLMQAGTGWPEDKKGLDKLKTGKNTHFSNTLSASEPIVVENYNKEKRFKPDTLIKGTDIVSGIAVTLKGKDERPLGVIGAYSSGEQKFSENDKNFMQIAANILGEFISRKRAEEQLMQSNKKLKQANVELRNKIEETKRLQDEIIGISERERWHTGQYLHDELGQSMVAAQIQVNSVINEYKKNNEVDLDELKEVVKLLEVSGNNIRELSHEITPVNIEHGGVEHAFETLIYDAFDFAGSKTELNFEIPENLIKNEYVATHLHRIAKEALKNALRHGNPDHISVSLTTDNQRLLLTVEDDGSGYERTGEENGVGIYLMEYRTSLIDGTFEIKQRDEEGGTVVRCSIPLEQVKKNETFKDKGEN